MYEQIYRYLAEKLCRLKRFPREQYGGALVLVGLSLPVLVGMVALAVDIGLWYKQRRQYQTAADAAAIGAAWQRLKGTSTLTTFATRDATRNGVTASSTVTITVNNPPTSGAYNGEPEAVEVIITVTESTLLSSIIYSGAMKNVVRAVGVV